MTVRIENPQFIYLVNSEDILPELSSEAVIRMDYLSTAVHDVPSIIARAKGFAPLNLPNAIDLIEDNSESFDDSVAIISNFIISDTHRANELFHIISTICYVMMKNGKIMRFFLQVNN